MLCESVQEMSKIGNVSVAAVAARGRDSRKSQRKGAKHAMLSLFLCGVTIAVILGMPQHGTAAAVTVASGSGVVLRLRRHGINACDKLMEWENPCGGDGSQIDASGPFPPAKHYYERLQNMLAIQKHSLKRQQAIQLDDMPTYGKHNDTYKFLPQLKPNAAIHLKMWFHKMQTYVASIVLLHTQQHSWEHSRQLPCSDITQELHNMFTSSVQVLCEIQTAINGSYANMHAKLNGSRRDQMNQQPKFPQRPVGPQAAEKIDLQYTKHKYLCFVDDMLSKLTKYMQRSEEEEEHNGSDDTWSYSPASPRL